MKSKPGIESKTTSSAHTAPSKTHVHQVIDTVLATMYANDAGGYLGVNSKVFKGEALRRINSQLDTLDKKARTGLEDDTKYRISNFEEFSHLPNTIRREVLQIAKERQISIEQAYKEKEKK